MSVFVTRKQLKIGRVRKRSVRLIPAMDCAGLWKGVSGPAAGRRGRVTFCGLKPVRMRPLFSS